jgi:hypothetical protein
MTDTTAAPEDRYVVAVYGPNEYKIFDRSYDRDNAHGWFSTWASAHGMAQRLNREARAANKPAAEQIAPCCNCSAKLKEAEETAKRHREEAERYRCALAQIWRHGSGDALRYAHDALFASARAKGK